MDGVGVEEEGRWEEESGGELDLSSPLLDSLFGGVGYLSLDDMGNAGVPRSHDMALLRRELKRRDQEILRLQREVHKLRSVLHQSTRLRNDEVLGTLHTAIGMAGQTASNKKQGVSAESSSQTISAGAIILIKHDKDFRSKHLIKMALLENNFLRHLDPGQLKDIIECMYVRDCVKGSYLIKEGEAGSHLYVSASGEFEVIKNGKGLTTIGPGRAFGELAILYNCTRTASVKVVETGEVWVLDRRMYQNIMMRSGMQRIEDSVTFLRSVPLLHNLNTNILTKIADSMQLEFFPEDLYIIRQGTSGDKFYIMSDGNVKVTQKNPEGKEEEIRILSRGDYFGEQALLKKEFRTANVIALSPGVECLTLDRESFTMLIGDLNELKEKDYGDENRIPRSPSKESFSDSDTVSDREELDLEDLDIVTTLGIGGFGRVELVKSKKGQVYALKCMKKCHIVETHQISHVYNEKDILITSRSPFICRLYQTFKDAKYVYLLMEACLGGEVWSLLRDRAFFDDSTACFITACVVEALGYLHKKNIVYRDLKPENLMLDNQGFVKLVDFGFAKKIPTTGGKTWTFCGTPEYVAPEVILNRGHDKSADYWALGILMFELLSGVPPFSGSDPMKIYNHILKGIEKVDFPRQITRTAQELIKKLCRETPGERLGMRYGGIMEIKKDKWFQGFDWNGLVTRTIVPPIVPKITSPTDTSNFDKYAKETDFPPDEMSNWDKDF